MKKILKTIILVFVFVGTFTFLFGCDQMNTPKKEQLATPTNINIELAGDYYYFSCDLVEHANKYSIKVYNSTKTVLSKTVDRNESQILEGAKLILGAGEWNIACTSIDTTGEYAESEMSDFTTVVVESSSGSSSGTDEPGKTHEIHYILNGGSFTGEVAYSYDEGSVYTLPTPVKSGLGFLGWYTDSLYTTPITKIDTYHNTNIYVYAKWEAEVINTEYTGYYAEASNLRGSQLKAALRTIISRNVSDTTYEQLKTYLAYTDQDPANSNNVILIFSKASVKGKWDGGNTWNREHMWPQSLSWFKTSGAGSDLHHIRPVDPTVNSTYHNNRKYGMVNNGSEGKFNGQVVCHYTSNYFEPQDSAKGDTARIIFYLLTRYSQSDSYSVTAVAQSMAMLLDWHNLDPVDNFELTRNERSFEKQGNRNPFIDHPEFAQMIWG